MVSEGVGIPSGLLTRSSSEDWCLWPPRWAAEMQPKSVSSMTARTRIETQGDQRVIHPPVTDWVFSAHIPTRLSSSKMLDALRRRSSSTTKATLPPSSPATEALAAMLQSSSPPHPYDTPLPNGRCYLSELPSEVLTRTFLKLDRVSLARCFRVSPPYLPPH